MKWATRANIHIDRAACAWLIRRHIDPDAEFVFLDDPTRIPSDATGFDMRGVEPSHHNGDCSFETIPRRYQLDDPVLWRLAAIIHEADLDDERYDAPEAPGLDTALRGLSMICTDAQILHHTSPCSTASTNSTAAPPPSAANLPEHQQRTECGTGVGVGVEPIPRLVSSWLHVCAIPSDSQP